MTTALDEFTQNRHCLGGGPSVSTKDIRVKETFASFTTEPKDSLSYYDKKRNEADYEYLKQKESLPQPSPENPTLQEATYGEILQALNTTIKEDEANKLILFNAMLLTYTDQDQQNIALISASSTGKSYLALEIASFFPEEDVMVFGGVSPKAFIHEKGTPVFEGPQDDEGKPRFSHYEVNLANKILIFLDQPHDQLLQVLRPLLSHDQREITFKFTDKSDKYGLATKKAIIIGFPTVIYASAKAKIDEQEATRFWILSPETTQEKLKNSADLLALKHGDRERYQQALEQDKNRAWLKERVRQIRGTAKYIIVPQAQAVVNQFQDERKGELAPRHLRDIPRMLAMIKAHALFNCFNRNTDNNLDSSATTRIETIIAEQDDVIAGRALYNQISASNEASVSPEVYTLYEECVKPLFVLADNLREGVTRKDIQQSYRQHFRKPINYKRLTTEILPMLVDRSILEEFNDPNDKRQLRYRLLENNILGMGGVSGKSDYKNDVYNKEELLPPTSEYNFNEYGPGEE